MLGKKGTTFIIGLMYKFDCLINYSAICLINLSPNPNSKPNSIILIKLVLEQLAYDMHAKFGIHITQFCR